MLQIFVPLCLLSAPQKHEFQFALQARKSQYLLAQAKSQLPVFEKNIKMKKAFQFKAALATAAFSSHVH